MKHKLSQDEIVSKRIKIEEHKIAKINKVSTAFVIPEIVTKMQMCSVVKPNEFKCLYKTLISKYFVESHPIRFSEYILANTHIFSKNRELLFQLTQIIKMRLVNTEPVLYNLWYSNLWIFNMDDQKNTDIVMHSLCLFSKPEDLKFLTEQPDIVSNFMMYENLLFQNFVMSEIQRSEKWDHLLLTVFAKLKKRFIKKLANEYLIKQNNRMLAMESAYLHMKWKIPISTGMFIVNIRSNSLICSNGIEYKLDNHNTNYFVFTKSHWKLQRDFLPVVTMDKNTSEIVKILMKKMKPDIIATVILFSGLCDLKASPNMKRREYDGRYKNTDAVLLIDYIAPYLFRVNTKQELFNRDVLRDILK